MKLAHHYDFESLIFTGSSKVFLSKGYDDHILPQFATWTKLPEFDEQVEQCRYLPSTDTWLVEAKLVEVTAYHKTTQQEKTFDDLSLLTDEYTTIKPATEWDEWFNESWVTNLSNKYIADYDAIDNTRRALYREISDPLYMESYRKKENGLLEEAAIFKAQADAAVEKIQVEHPFPIAPVI